MRRLIVYNGAGMRRHLQHPGRREFLQALAGTAALAWPRVAGAQSGPSALSTTSATKLGARVTIITGAGNNVIALAGDAGSLLVDAGDAAHARDVLRDAGKVSTVFNTHYH